VHITIKDQKWDKVIFEESEPRQPGLHLGQVIKSLMDKSGLGYKGKGFADMELTAEIGTLWERVFSKAAAEKYIVRPPQMEMDGVWLSLDGVGPDPEGRVPLVVIEYKVSWSSTNKSPSDNFYYMAQVKSYCKAVDTKVVVFHNFHVMGDYKGSGPVYRVARIEFSKKEIEDNWRMIVQHKRGMGE
jgi:hypothetical protein